MLQLTPIDEGEWAEVVWDASKDEEPWDDLTDATITLRLKRWEVAGGPAPELIQIVASKDPPDDATGRVLFARAPVPPTVPAGRYDCEMEVTRPGIDGSAIDQFGWRILPRPARPA